MGMQKDLPNAVAILILGIVSIVTCWCYGVIGLGCGIAALVMASKAMREYNGNPGIYTRQSFNNMKAGRICGIIGTILSGLYLLYFIVIIIFFGSALMSAPWSRF